MESSRRELLKNIAFGFGTIGATQALARGFCSQTPAQTSGPFYPKNFPMDQDNNLLWVKGSTEVARGRQIHIVGTATDSFCQPIESVLVEIWQACESGRYNHASETNPAWLDPNFQYWGKAITDKEGKFEFFTIYPGAYPADRNWVRPPHIHTKLSKLGYKELTTQLYFEGEALNTSDLILNDLSAADQQSLVMKAGPADQNQFFCQMVLTKYTSPFEA